ncbi:hypothetical protein LTR56_027190 [Elasticomyces elasticus]|nr:hypothetical protein LTR56_027190 [Elasticomyces elasticus]
MHFDDLWYGSTSSVISAAPHVPHRRIAKELYSTPTVLQSQTSRQKLKASRIRAGPTQLCSRYNSHTMSGSDEQKPSGLLSMIGDPLGKVLEPVLKPTLGKVTGAIGEPTGDAMNDVRAQAKREKGYTDEEKPEEEWWGGKALGTEQAGGNNPLGLSKQ